MKRWLISDKGDLSALRLAEDHYTRQTHGSRQFCRNGENLVFVTADDRAVWVSHRPSPGRATRADRRDSWECTLFRTVRDSEKSRELIREATALVFAIWGPPPTDGLISYVDPSKVMTGTVEGGVVGYCFRRAGWRRVGYASDGKPLFRAPRPHILEDWREWSFKSDRGGVVRERLITGHLGRYA